VRYDADLGQRPEILVVSKCELPEAEAVREALAGAAGREVLAISSATGQGLDALRRAVAVELDRRESGR
jgi:GTP-binding protein